LLAPFKGDKKKEPKSPKKEKKKEEAPKKEAAPAPAVTEVCYSSHVSVMVLIISRLPLLLRRRPRSLRRQPLRLRRLKPPLLPRLRRLFFFSTYHDLYLTVRLYSEAVAVEETAPVEPAAETVAEPAKEEAKVEEKVRFVACLLYIPF
jgi:hypothetical protein